MEKKKIDRRGFLKLFGVSAATSAVVLTGCKPSGKKSESKEYSAMAEPQKGKMSYRINPKTKEKVSILGYGMMRLPLIGEDQSRESTAPIDQEMVNREVDYALEHGVNYFDTSPAYCQGRSEASTGLALKRHKRKDFFIATKLSNFNQETWSHEASMEMYKNSFKALQTDYIDYYLLHGIGMGGMDALHGRYLDNGMLDFLVQERAAGRIRNLGFSYHGDVKVFDYLLSLHDKYKWDFVQIELNYLDWKFANEINDRNTDAEYLYEELEIRSIPAVIMEPLLGGRLSNLPQPIAVELKKRDPERSVASWAFRYAATRPGVLTLLSGMTWMEHLKDNLRSLDPLKPLTDEEMIFLEDDIAHQIMGFETIPCNACNYCMPCPYGVNIPAIFVHYNKIKNEGRLPGISGDENYRKYRRDFLIGYDRAVPKLRQASHCIGCGQCMSHCPQNIMIPTEMRKIDKFVELLKQEE